MPTCNGDDVLNGSTCTVVGPDPAGNGPNCPSSPSSPNPIMIGTGNKWLAEEDMRGNSTLRITRYYNSSPSTGSSIFGERWISMNLERLEWDQATGNVRAYRSNGKAFNFQLSGNIYVATANIVERLYRETDTGGVFTGWRMVNPENSIERYDTSGRLTSVTDANGLSRSFSYDVSNGLASVTDNFGRSLTFTYDPVLNRVIKIVGPAGEIYRYAYDANNNLVSVTYPDNKVKQYIYNESAFTNGVNLPHVLTGVVDENGVRYASYYYDSSGRAIKEELAPNLGLGIERHSFTYASDASGNPVSTSLTDPLGTIRTYNFQLILGVAKNTGQSQPGGSGCGPASSALTYDDNGNIATRADFNGNVTKYVYDLTRNLETSRTEAFGKPEARTITTQWHATYRLPMKIAEPLRITTNDYDGSGNLLKKTVQATSDTNGSQGFAGAAVGTPRIWSYTYNNVGQVLTATGPRTDVVDRTTYTYNATTGNLETITNAVGHVTTLSNYDPHGRVGRIVDPNGMTTDLVYHVRGWLTSKTVSGVGGGAETTDYKYDDVGQMTRVTNPDGSAIFYTYDGAHRLTDIADSLGNTIHYVLDAMGNRTKEEVKDPSGTLTRQTARIYDALNRLQQVTGGAQ